MIPATRKKLRVAANDAKAHTAPHPSSPIPPMILDDAFAAIQQIFSRPFRRVFDKTLALTLLLLVFVFVAVERLLIHFLILPNPY